MWFKKSKIKSANVIDNGSTVHGVISSTSCWRIVGVFQGDLKTKGDIHVESKAEIDGSLEGANIWVAGKVTGRIKANRHLFLSNSCSIHGEIAYKKLEMQEGASFTGKSRTDMAPSERENANRPIDAPNDKAASPKKLQIHGPGSNVYPVEIYNWGKM